MTEDEARDQIRVLVNPDGFDRLASLAAIVSRENAVQNLIARSTLAQIWTRHILDSVQLLPLAKVGPWLDIGTGGGFPGLAIAAADPQREMILVEPRRLRAAFLERAASELGLTNVTVRQAKVERVAIAAATISARAVASTATLLAAARHCADADTRWLLFRGAVAGSDDLTHTGMMFHVKQSLTDPSSSIAVLTGVPQ